MSKKKQGSQTKLEVEGLVGKGQLTVGNADAVHAPDARGVLEKLEMSSEDWIAGPNHCKGKAGRVSSMRLTCKIVYEQK
jgi:hypothetical protein